MNKIAFIFPGQGAQSVGMGKDFYENFESSRAVFEKANSVLNKDIKKLCFEGPEEDLKQTINTQPAILTTSLAMLSALFEKTNIKPDFCAGHSLGEYCALYTAGVLSLEDTFLAIQKRASLMNETKGGAMSAILGLDKENIEKCVNEAKEYGKVSVANYNEPNQTVITGETQAVQKAGEFASELGAKKVIPLAVSGAFHSELMENASNKFNTFLDSITLNDSKIPVITNVDAQETKCANEFRSKMPKQISSSVFWYQSIQKMIDNNVNIFIEIGPGRVLAGLNRKISSEIKTYNVNSIESLEKTVEELNLTGV